MKTIKSFLLLLVLFSLTQVFAQDPSSYLSWGITSPIQQGGVNLGHERIKGQKQVIVAVIDTGIDFDHPFLKDNVYAFSGPTTASNYGKDFSQRPAASETPADIHGHGTHVSGIIRSVYPDVKILPLKYFGQGSSGQENLNATIAALEYAVKANVDVINYSGGGPEPSVEELRILKIAEQKGILVVAAAGNEHSDIDQKENAYYPASYRLKNIISVTAHDQNIEILPSSNWGKNSVDLSAPGYQIKSSLPQGRAGLMTGTSQATAFVSGVAALIKAQYPELSATTIRKILIASAKKFGQLKGKSLSGGIVNAAEALELAGKLGHSHEVAKSVSSAL